MAKLKITLVKSTIGSKKDQIATVKALGLHKMHSLTPRDKYTTKQTPAEEDSSAGEGRGHFL